jgi:hypothetical protein
VTLNSVLDGVVSILEGQTDDIDQWSGVKVPRAPELKKVKADPQTTAFPRSTVVALPTLAMANAG